ncbi:MAG: hypothetical protein CMN30_24605 [Sandaracinus sp.]|nr:hypothetical protein [Sandaracinus sp.]|tara:strand:+ start:926 stop:2377 length:1452 start_codon:yes stop_codon:yes gene_type:complete
MAPLPRPYARADDTEVVRGCIEGDDDAWASLRERFEAEVETIVIRVLDERRFGSIDLREVPSIVDQCFRALQRNDGGPLRLWKGGRLRAYLATVVRHEAEEHAMEDTPLQPLVAHPPTPALMQLDRRATSEEAIRVREAIAKLVPRATAIVRLRLRGLSMNEIAATLGQPVVALQDDLGILAERLATAQRGDSVPAWRGLLDCATVEERVATALRTEDDEDFRAQREIAAATWRSIRDETLVARMPRTPGPLQDALGVAAFVDGSWRGAERTRAEGHLATCGRCVDTVAMLTLDLRALDILRGAQSIRPAAAAASCIATGRFEAGRVLAQAAEGEDSTDISSLLGRLAEVGASLEEGTRQRSNEGSRVISMAALPTDVEAPVVAFEALVAGDPIAAERAIDDHVAKQTVGQRLRLLALAVDEDRTDARGAAEAVLGSPSPDPGLRRDAATILALPTGRGLPRECLAERLRDALPDGVRFLVSR